jgi:hypothetical protein
MNARRFSLLTLVCLVASLLAQVAGSQMAGAVASQTDRTRSVTATAFCRESSGTTPTQMTVTVTNDFGLPIIISYVGGFTTGAALNPSFLPQTSTTPELSRTIEDGTWIALQSVYDAIGTNGVQYGGSLVVTTAGVLMPMCDGERVGLMDDPGVMPRTDSEAEYSAIAIATMTLGRLESLRAYEALYSLLHPDVQGLVSFSAMACWYAGELGVPGQWKDSVFSTSFEDAQMISDWTWISANITYDRAAEVNYTQRIGTMSSSDEVEAEIHLVDVDGVWRWFFGNRVNSLNHLDTNCGL